ncbi:RES family NAD+ phosphorylase [Robbsia sp. KACC 23696]|uniref:RES family NAD+ phosphorylase n=1 Tax=Robbsia sp. KACC 23696 TaxID=3149231 RepID=UPI00325A9B11
MVESNTKGSRKRILALVSNTDTPLPASVLHTSLLTWPTRRLFHRIHREAYRPNQFNDTARGNARFSPIVDLAGSVIPTLYGGATFDCSAMETVFHDIPFAPGYKTFDKQKLIGIVHSRLLPLNALQLVDLRTKALRKLGVRRAELIDTEQDRYPKTRLWAEAIHAQCPEAQGMCWTSRQDDSAEAIVLFGDRIASSDLETVDGPTPLLGDESTYDAVLSLADRIGVNVVSGR